jgi:hypothetical protein
MELRSLLSPKITLRRPFVWDGEVADGADETVRIKQLVDWDLVLAEDNVHAVLQDQSKGEWEKALRSCIRTYSNCSVTRWAFFEI